MRHGRIKRDQELQALGPSEWVARLLLLGRLMRSSMRHQASANAVKRILWPSQLCLICRVSSAEINSLATLEGSYQAQFGSKFHHLPRRRENRADDKFLERCGTARARGSRENILAERSRLRTTPSCQLRPDAANTVRSSKDNRSMSFHWCIQQECRFEKGKKTSYWM